MATWPESRTGRLLAKLEVRHGTQAAPQFDGPFEMILWEIVAYLASEERRTTAFESLRRRVGMEPAKILKSPLSKLTEITRQGSAIAAEERAARLRVAAEHALKEFDGDLSQLLKLPAQKAKKALMKFPMIGEPGAEKILLFCGALDVLALESNGLRTACRLFFGAEGKSYAAAYRAVRTITLEELPPDPALLTHAHLLLKKHGQEVCLRREPACSICPLNRECANYLAANRIAGRGELK